MRFQFGMIFDQINFIVGKSLRSPGNRLLCSKVAVVNGNLTAISSQI